MLFPYKYVPHRMEKMQEFIDYIFYKVWCKASSKQPFSLSLFSGNSDLKEVMKAFYYSDAKGADFFYGHVESIYNYFVNFTVMQINQLRLWYNGNNDIEKSCANDTSIHNVRYDGLNNFGNDLTEKMASFFKGLYEKSLLELSALKNKIGTIDGHYQSFMNENKKGKCPFCGIADIKGVHHSKREAYDHYLPKGLYPFNSINFHNIVPTCHECNSTYKLSKDTIYSSTGKRKAFYPYNSNTYNIEIDIDLDQCDGDNITPENIKLNFGPPELNEEIETWKEVYGIAERYKAKCSAENDGKYWLGQILDEWHGDGRSPDEFLEILNRSTAKSPYADSNFLKKPFLEGCKKAGLLTT